MYLDNEGADENGAVMTSDQIPATKEDHLLRGTIDDARGIHNKLWRWIEEWGTESSDTSYNVKANIMKCLQKHRKLSTKGNHYTIVGSPYISWANPYSSATRPIESSRRKRRRGDVQKLVAQGWATSECWGPVGEGKYLAKSYVVLRTCPRIFSEVAELTRHSTITTTKRLKTKRGFTLFCKGLGIYCNGFWGCGALGPHKCNQKWPKSLYKRSRDSKGKDINTLYHRCMLSVLSCISYRQVYWSRERERVLWPFCAQRLWREEKRREEKKERDYEEVCSWNFVTSFTEYNKDKVPMDVATSLVVNHVNIGVLCLCLYLGQSYRSKDKT